MSITKYISGFAIIITILISFLLANCSSEDSSSTAGSSLQFTLNENALPIINRSGRGDLLSAYGVADFNNDGFNDIIFGSPYVPWVDQSTEITVLLNNGSGHFIDSTSTFISGSIPGLNHDRKYRVADFNGDGLPDLFLGGHGYDVAPFPGEANALLLSQNGLLENKSENLNTTDKGFTHAAAIGDIDSDGDIDIIVPELFVGAGSDAAKNATLYVLINDGSGNFTSHEDLGQIEYPYTSAELADLNNDGFLDLVLGMSSKDSLNSIVLWNNGSGDFSQAGPYSTSALPTISGIDQVNDIEVMDINSDGFKDLLLAAQTEGLAEGPRAIQVLINDQSGNFSDMTSEYMPELSSGHYVDKMTPADIDNDGDLDIIGSYDIYIEGETAFVWLNDGSGHFTIASSGIFHLKGGMVPIDADNDGDIDLAVIGWELCPELNSCGLLINKTVP